jgi:hypothetical protein
MIVNGRLASKVVIVTASDESAFITGAALAMDGGSTASA